MFMESPDFQSHWRQERFATQLSPAATQSVIELWFHKHFVPDGTKR